MRAARGDANESQVHPFGCEYGYRIMGLVILEMMQNKNGKKNKKKKREKGHIIN